MNYIPYIHKPVISGMGNFNITSAFDRSTSDFLSKNSIQDFILAPFAPYRAMNLDSFLDCNGPTCIGFRIHDNIEYTIVASNWSRQPPVPTYSTTWKSDFDREHGNWDVFTVANASTIQIEFSTVGPVLFNDTDCSIYGYPYLAVQICLKQGTEPNIVFLGSSSASNADVSRVRMRPY